MKTVTVLKCWAKRCQRIDVDGHVHRVDVLRDAKELIFMPIGFMYSRDAEEMMCSSAG